MEKNPYSIRYSHKAQSLQLRLSAKGLEVIIPKTLKYLSNAKVEEFIRLKQPWINKHKQFFSTPKALALPSFVSLCSLNESWKIAYETHQISRLTLIPDPQNKKLLMLGDTSKIESGLKLLRQWLIRKAKRHLPPWLSEVAEEIGLTYHKVSIRNNKTRFGSCSSEKNISLSCQLLFLPPIYVRHIMIHELCHTKKMHHGASFWALFKKYDTNALIHAKEIKVLAKEIPTWIKD